MCDGKNDCPLTETSSGGEDEEGCAEGSGQVDDYDDDGGGGDRGGGDRGGVGEDVDEDGGDNDDGDGDDVQTFKKRDVNKSRLIQCEDQY